MMLILQCCACFAAISGPAVVLRHLTHPVLCPASWHRAGFRMTSRSLASDLRKKIPYFRSPRGPNMQPHESCDTEPVREDWRLLLFLAALRA
jgi:hypothetical protein